MDRRKHFQYHKHNVQFALHPSNTVGMNRMDT